jgi:hypothetical protein
MSSLRRDLVERKLWMVVAILVVAVVAVPMFLLKGASASTTPTVPAPPGATTSSAQTTTTATTPSAEPAKVELARIARDPFAASVPKLSAKPSSTASATTSSTSASTASSTGSTASSGSATVAMVSPTPAATGSSAGSGASTGAASTSPTTSTPTPTSTIASAPASTQATDPAKVQSWTIYSVSIRFGKKVTGPVHHNIERLTALPSAGNPQLMFYGVMSGGQRAVFGLGAGVAHAGTGLCRPSHTSCSAIVLSAGQSEEVAWPTATGSVAQAMLQLVKITKTVTHSREAALKAYKRVSMAGVCDLSLAQPVLYDPDTGTVQNFPKDACGGQAASAPFAFQKTTP